MNNKSLHIVLVSPAGYGGIQTWCIMYGHFLLNQGYNVTIIWEQDKLNIKNNPKVDKGINEINFEAGIYVNQNYIIKRISKILKNADVVYPNTSTLAFHGLNKLKANRPLIIAGCHSIDPHDINTISEFEPICDAIFTISEYMNKLLKQKINNHKYNKIKLIRHGVKLHYEITPIKLTNRQINLLFVGRFDENKRPITTVKIFQKLLEKNIKAHLTLIGDGKLKSQVIEVIENSGLNNHIKLIDSINTEKIRDIYSASHFTLLLSHSEGFGLVALEAMASGSIPIVTDSTGISEIIQHGKNGYVVSTDNTINETVKVILDTISSNNLFSNLLENGYNTVQNSYTNTISFNNHIDLLKSVLKNRNNNTTSINMQIKTGSLDNTLIPNFLTFNIRKFKYLIR